MKARAGPALVMPLVMPLLLLLAGCDLSMTRQDRHEAQSSPSLWPGGPAVSMPDGAVAQDQPARDAALNQPPLATLALLERGRERYTIYCTPCHGADGAGKGPVVQRGFPQPAPFAAVPGDARHIVDVVGAGYGVMYGFADRIEPADRWAIAAYVKALEHSVPARLHGNQANSVILTKVRIHSLRVRVAGEPRPTAQPNNLKSAVFASPSGKAGNRYQPSREWMLTFVSVTGRMRTAASSSGVRS